MAWIVAAVVLILLVVSAGFRKVALAGVVIVALAGAVLYFYTENQERHALTLISASDLSFDDVRLGSDTFGYKLVGRLTNKSRHTMTSVTLKVMNRPGFSGGSIL